MANCTATRTQVEAFVNQMSVAMTEIAQRLSAGVLAEAQSLGVMEQQVLQAVKGLGNQLLNGLLALHTSPYASPAVPCQCGQTATYQRQRETASTTLLGRVHLKRAYYLCASCHGGQAPLDQQLGWRAGGLSAGLHELLALLGAGSPFEDAAALVHKLTLVEVCANSVAAATEELGAAITRSEQKQVAIAWDQHRPQLPPAPAHSPERLYVSMDGTLVHTREAGWKELKLGAVYSTRTTVPRQRPEQVQIRAQDISFHADFAEPADFGRALFLEAQRRGVLQAREVVVIGDGAHWIWKLAEEHFPDALQIVDWYHASQYTWNAASAIYGEGTALAKQWAKQRLDELWAGDVVGLLAQLHPHAERYDAVQQAVTYYTNNQTRLQYPDYRARGLQIGSGSIESGCKHVIGARMKQAGMLWSIPGAQAVAKVRARLKSKRWDETIAQHPPAPRAYQRIAA